MHDEVPIGQHAQDLVGAGVRTMASPVSGWTSMPRRAAKLFTRTASSSLVRVCGVDATDQLSDRETVIVTPHPDDETLGCGATIARMRSRGVPVNVIFVTGGGRSPAVPGAAVVAMRRSEAIRAMAVLGVDREALQFLNFQDGTLPNSRLDVAQALTEALRSTSATQVMVTSAKDRHPDHAAVAGAARLAVSRAGSPIHLYEYPIWQRMPAVTVAGDLANARLRRPGDGRRVARWRPHLVLTEHYLALKRKAIAAYASQLPHFPSGFVDDFLLPFEAFSEVIPVGEGDLKT